MLIVFDPRETEHNNFPKRDWDDFYSDVKECILPDMPEPLGEEVILCLYADANYAGNGSNRRSRTGFFALLNEAPICWHSKKQTRIENSVFSSEFISMRTGLETNKVSVTSSI